MSFHSILFERSVDGGLTESVEPPDCFRDLNLDQLVTAITAGRADYGLAPFFHVSLREIDGIRYRQEALQDLEVTELWERIALFAEEMRSMRDQLIQAGKLHYRFQQQAWFLQAVATYQEAITGLSEGLTGIDLRSRAFRAFRDYLAGYVKSSGFASFVTETKRLQEQLGGIRYCLHIEGNRIRVSRFEGQEDYTAEVEESFRRFKRGAPKDYRMKISDWVDMNHVEAGILERVALLYPDLFRAIDAFCQRNREYLDGSIGQFDREVQFYVAYLQFISRFKPAGLRFCYPSVTDQSKEIAAQKTFDLALANKLVPDHKPVVTNDFRLGGRERILVVTGPNQGGKTTFARTFGQLHYVASLGLPVPGEAASLFLADQIFTHFEREENLDDLRGKLEDDLVRIHDILGQATPASILIMNEIFTSTTLRDSTSLGKKVLKRVMELDLLCVCVTFVDELSSLGPATVSMVSGVSEQDPTERTFKIERRPADGRAYAVAIAAKHGLTAERLKERLVR